ncbi:MAG: guanylate kinase [Candidatus Krumholzibacteriota bacterium]|nr:guanylate kinase [Candidatus Krumholzibacteriota bacterium]
MIIVVSGPSGAGKSTVVKAFLESSASIVPSVSLTTREPRKGEVEGIDYFFVSEEEFDLKRKAGELLEWAEVHGNLYGTLSSFVDMELARGHDLLLEIDVQGGLNVKGKRPEALMIFLLPPSMEELEKRLRGRDTDSEEVIVKRLANARKEIGFAGRYDFSVINDAVSRSVEEIRAIIESARQRRSGRDQIS